MNNKTWILVADAFQAKIYSTQKATLFNGDGRLELISEHTHPKSRQHERELVTDKSGRFGKATFVEPDPKRHEEEIFAKKLADVLEKGREDKHFHELILIAPPLFIGMLHKQLSSHINKLVNLTIEKDYTKCDAKELIAHLQEYL